MKKFLSILGLVAMSATAYAQLDTDIVNIPDANFKAALVSDTAINTNGDAEITYGEAKIYKGFINVSNKGVTDLTGIEAFVGITDLFCANNLLTSLDVSKNIALSGLYCYENLLTNLNVSGAIALKDLHCYKNQLTSLDVSNHSKLTNLSCQENRLTNLNVNGAVALTNLDCYRNQLTQLNVDTNTVLTELWCSENQLVELNVDKATILKTLYCYKNRLTQLNLSNNTVLKDVSCYNNALLQLDVSRNTFLTKLACSNNQLSQLNLSRNVNLSSLDCSLNKINTLDLSNNSNLREVRCSSNQFIQLNIANGNNSIITFANVSGNPSLECIQIDKGFIPNSSWFKDTTAQWNNTGKTCAEFLSVTNFEKTTLKLLNPVKESLIIKGDAKIEKVEIYNVAGQLVKVLVNNNTNVSGLAKGIYLVKITTNNGVVTEKIIKE